MSVAQVMLIDKPHARSDPYCMFSAQICSHPGCNSYVSPPFDTCFHHSDSQERKIILGNLEKILSQKKNIKDITIVGGDFENVNVRERRLTASNFAFSTFTGCDFSSCDMYTCFFDMCIFINCRFDNLEASYSIFSGSDLRGCSFTGSSLINCNFMGIDSVGNDFSHSDLYFSNFSMSKIFNTSFDDCNLKRVNFRASAIKNVSFRYSNPEEAFFKDEVEDVMS